MDINQRPTAWRVIGETVLGSAHQRNNLPNQDAILGLPSIGDVDCGDSPIILAVADGHGSAKSFRSDVGAQLAVTTAGEALRRFFSGDWQGGNLSIIKQSVEQQLPRELVRAWREAVDLHLQMHPIETAENERLSEQEGAKAVTNVAENQYLAYGATLLLAGIGQEFLVYLQLGDGELVTVSTRGEVGRPLEGDKRLFANATTSLCSPNSWNDFRTSVQLATREQPAMILLATDGYSNSFRDDASFLKAGRDYLELLRTDGCKTVESSLRDWLCESTEMSGDDVTVGILARLDALTETSGSNSESVEVAQATDEVQTESTDALPQTEKLIEGPTNSCGDKQ